MEEWQLPLTTDHKIDFRKKIQQAAAQIPGTGRSSHNQLERRRFLLDLMDKVEGAGQLAKTDGQTHQIIVPPIDTTQYPMGRIFQSVQDFMEIPFPGKGMTGRLSLPKASDGFPSFRIEEGRIRGF